MHIRIVGSSLKTILLRKLSGVRWGVGSGGRVPVAGCQMLFFVFQDCHGAYTNRKIILKNYSFGAVGGVTGGCRGGTWGRSFERRGAYREPLSEGSRRAVTVVCNTERMYGSLRSDEKRKGMRSAEGKVWVGERDGGDGWGVWWVCVDYG